MPKKKPYTLPDLPYDYNALEPYISEEQLKVHHDKHHQGYTDKSNAILEKINKARESGENIDIKATLKFLSFNIGGHILHSLFWKNMRPSKEGDNKPGDELAEAINEEFGSFERFKKEFTGAASSVEGSGWAALVYEKESGRLLVDQIEKHNLVLYPNSEIIMVLDVWEHAFYIDYKNEKAKFIDGFWNIVNWEQVNKRLKEASK